MNSVRPIDTDMDAILSGDVRISGTPSSYVNWAIDYLASLIPKVDSGDYQKIKHFMILVEACMKYKECERNECKR